MLRHLGGRQASLEFDGDASKYPDADALQGLLGLPIHGSQDLREHPEQGQPEAQKLVGVAVVVSIVPDMVASVAEESLNPVKQVPGEAKQHPCQPTGPAERLPN